MGDYKSQDDIIQHVGQAGVAGLGVAPAKNVLDSLEATGDWDGLNSTATANITTDVNHRGGGSVSLEFDKAAGNTTCGLAKTITDDNGLKLGSAIDGYVTFYFFLPAGAAAANFETLRFTMGTDASHNYIWNIPIAALNAGGWTLVRCDIDKPDTITGNGIDFDDVTYMAVSAIFTNAGDTLADMLVDTISIESSSPRLLPGDVFYQETSIGMSDANPAVGHIFDVRPYTRVNVIFTDISYGAEASLTFTISEYATLSSTAVPYTEWSSADPKVAAQPSWQVTAAIGETEVKIALDVDGVNYLQVNADADVTDTGTYTAEFIGSR